MNHQFYIERIGGDRWRGDSWTGVRNLAVQYSHDEAARIIHKRWSCGLKERTRNGKIVIQPAPKLVLVR